MGSWGAIYNNAIYGVRLHTSRMTMLQEQIATGNRIIRSSDGPSDAYRIMSLRQTEQEFDNYFKNLDETEVSLLEGSNALQQISNITTRVGVLVAQGSTGTYGEQNREAIAEEINELLEQSVSLANHRVLGRYIFGGADSTTKPFETTEENGRITSVRYVGSYDERPAPVAPSVQMSGQIVGDRVFRNHDRQDIEFYTDTGAKPGTGTASVRNDFWATISNHTQYPLGASGIQAGNDSNQDTIFGNHTITLDTVAQTLRLDGGPLVSYNPATDSNLEVTNAAGETIHVDMTGGALVGGTYNITSGQVQIEGGPATDIDFTDNNMVVEDRYGKVMYMDATGINKTGLVRVENRGTYDLFNTLIHVRDLLLNTHDLETNKQLEAMRYAQESIDEIARGFRQRITILGGRLGGIDRLRETLTGLQDQAEAEANAVEQADVVDVATDLARTQTLYQMSLAATGKVIKLTLLDFI
jgi:flagellar hook-associated protein 3